MLADSAVSGVSLSLCRYFDGKHSIVEICSIFGLRPSDLIAVCIADKDTVLTHV
eukprot:m.135841 g.135841  ORF g.135841 m.135841 type:complete len:54 (-) comp15858_c0_seq3:236-397(-)